MGSTSTFLAILVVFLIALNVGQFYYFTQVQEDEEVLNIQDLFGEDWEDFIGQDVTVQGYYVNASGPMLVSSLELVMMNLEIPNNSYIPLTGDVTFNDSEDSGAFVQVDGTVREVTEDGARDILQRISLEFMSAEVLIKPVFPYYYEVLEEFVILPNLTEISRYAVLISGGVDSNNNHYRYWNDMKFMYSILIDGYGYDPDNVKVIYANGVAEDADMPVNYSATVANVQTVFLELQTLMSRNDRLFIYTNDHGGGFWPADPYDIYVRGARVDTQGTIDENYLYSEAGYDRDFNSDGDKLDILGFDESLNLWGNEKLYDDDLAIMLDDLNLAVGANLRTIVVMEQCFSGGFIRDLSGPNRIILTACGLEEPSWSADTEGLYNEFTYHFMSAVNWETPYGVAVDADLDNNGWVTMEEAFNYASDHDSRSETPMYDDNGDGVGHPAPIPGGTTDGTIGSTTHL